MTLPLTPGRRALLVLGLPFSLGFIGYGTAAIVNAIGLTHYSTTTAVVPLVQVLNVNTGDSDVRLEPSPDGDVHVVSKGLYALHAPTVTTASTASGVTVTGGCADFAVISCSQQLTIQVPAAFTVTAKSGAGDVRAQGLTGRLALTSSAGDVRADGVTGLLTMHSSAGDVSGRSLRSADVSATSSSGDVALSFDADPTRVVAGTSAGDVEVRLPGKVSYAVTVHSTDGSATARGLRQDPSSPRTINASSSSGDVTVEPN